jgi:hypothetical protein
MRTIHVQTELPADADRVWQAMTHAATLSYLCRGVIGFPALAGRTERFVAGETGTGWLMLFHVIPLHRHTIHADVVDPATRTIRSREHGGVIRTWNHTLHAEPLGERRCRYSDTVEVDAGILTAAVAWIGTALFRYRQRRWRKLVRKHLSARGSG